MPPRGRGSPVLYGVVKRGNSSLQEACQYVLETYPDAGKIQVQPCPIGFEDFYLYKCQFQHLGCRFRVGFGPNRAPTEDEEYHWNEIVVTACEHSHHRVDPPRRGFEVCAVLSFALLMVCSRARAWC